MPQIEGAVIASFKLTFSDLFSVLFWFNFQRLWIMTALIPGCLILALLTSGGKTPRGENMLPGATIVFGVWAMVTFVIPYVGARAAMKNPNFQGEIQYTFSDAGVATAAKHATSHMDWEMVTRVDDTRRFLLITFSARNVIHPVPKSALSPEDLMALRALLRSHVKGKLRLKG